jgi:hypothetical protein
MGLTTSKSRIDALRARTAARRANTPPLSSAMGVAFLSDEAADDDAVEAADADDGDCICGPELAVAAAASESTCLLVIGPLLPALLFCCLRTSAASRLTPSAIAECFCVAAASN